MLVQFILVYAINLAMLGDLYGGAETGLFISEYVGYPVTVITSLFLTHIHPTHIEHRCHMALVIHSDVKQNTISIYTRRLSHSYDEDGTTYVTDLKIKISGLKALEEYFNIGKSVW